MYIYIYNYMRCGALACLPEGQAAPVAPPEPRRGPAAIWPHYAVLNGKQVSSPVFTLLSHFIGFPRRRPTPFSFSPERAEVADVQHVISKDYADYFGTPNGAGAATNHAPWKAPGLEMRCLPPAPIS